MDGSRLEQHRSQIGPLTFWVGITLRPRHIDTNAASLRLFPIPDSVAEIPWLDLWLRPRTAWETMALSLAGRGVSFPVQARM
jgi:hypothetical protein